MVGFGAHFLQSQRHTSLQNGKQISGSHSGWFPCKCCRNHTRKPRGPQETRPQNGKTAWPGRLTKAIQLFPHLRCQNVASESSKKCKVSFQLLVVSLQTKPWFWTTFPAKPAAHIAPKRTKKSGSHFWWFPCKCDRNQSRKLHGPAETRPQNGKTAWPGRLTKAIFQPLFPHLRCQNVASESSKKCKVSFQLLMVSLQTKPWFWTAFPAKPAAHIAPKWKTNIWITFLVVSMQMLYRNHTIESLVDLKKRGLKTGKQHGLAGSRRPFSNHFSPTSDVKTLRLNPLKNIRFRSSFWSFPCKRNHGFGSHFLQSQRRTSLQNELKRISGSHLGWFPCKCCRNHTRKPRGPQETRPQNGKTAWPGRLTKAIFQPLFPHLRCQNVASESSKKCKVPFQLLVVSLQTKPWFWTAYPAKPAAHIAPKWTKMNIWITFLVVSIQMLYRNHTIESLVDLKKRGLKTGKQHGLAGSRRPYNFSPTSDVKMLRLNPLKNVRFRSKQISGSYFWVVSMQMQ